MSDLTTVDTEELRTRMESVLLGLHSACQLVGPQVKQIGDLRAEAQMIYEELKRRGVLKESADGAGPTV